MTLSALAVKLRRVGTHVNVRCDAMHSTKVREAARFAAFAFVALIAAACTTKTVVRPAAGAPAVAPALTVERFLRAAAAEDLDTMARLFGTVDGPVTERDSRADIERRMALLARVLQHEDFRLITEGEIPGRSGIADGSANGSSNERTIGSSTSSSLGSTVAVECLVPKWSAVSAAAASSLCSR